MTQPATAATMIPEMLSIVQRHILVDGDCETRVPGLLLTRRSNVSQPVYLSQRPTFAMILQGRKTLHLAEQLYDYAVGDYVLISQHLPLVSRVTVASPKRPQLGFGVILQPERIAEVAAYAEVPPSSPPKEGRRGIAIAPLDCGLLEPTLRLLRLLDSPENIDYPATLYERELIYRLLTRPIGNQLLQRAREDSPASRVARAISWLRANFRTPVHIPMLAREAGMSESALYEQFKAVTALTPLQYRKHLQLQTARQRIVIDGLDIGTASHEVGYQSPSQFSRDYRRVFGRSPFEDLKSGAI